MGKKNKKANSNAKKAKAAALEVRWI